MFFSKKNIRPILIITVVLACIVIITYFTFKNVESFSGCVDTDGQSALPMPSYAQEACKKISTRAEEIEAEYEGKAKIIQNLPFAAWLNPNNYRAGDNKTNETIRNIISNNLSSCDATQIYNSCNNSSATYQSNTIDTSKCKLCATNPGLCSVKGNIQKNVDKVSQRCVINLSIAALLEKKNSVDAQALAKVLQKADGLLSGSNNTSIENCNIISTDMSTKSFLDQKSTCANKLAITQTNTMKGCGTFLDNIQENDADKMQTCVLGVDLISSNKAESTNKTFLDTSVDQLSAGLTLSNIIISLLVILLCCSSSLSVYYSDY